ncbi:MAG: DUF2778 domain-containing protein [Acidobacteria bacterium]|nr:DUF2778 domain-containing protein [Acidobacteriota bacterium]
MWSFSQSTGSLALDGVPIASGYSGRGAGRNDPDMQHVPHQGPIPRGIWKISGPPVDTPSHGPYVLHLFPSPATEVFSRDGFLIHGDSLEHPGCASQGCIILPRNIREQIWNSGDRILQVIE